METITIDKNTLTNIEFRVMFGEKATKIVDNLFDEESLNYKSKLKRRLISYLLNLKTEDARDRICEVINKLEV